MPASQRASAGTIPAWGTNASAMPALTNLAVSYASLSGTLPASLGHFPRLQELYFDNNRLTGVPQQLLSRSIVAAGTGRRALVLAPPAWHAVSGRRGSQACAERPFLVMPPHAGWQTRGVPGSPWPSAGAWLMCRASSWAAHGPGCCCRHGASLVGRADARPVWGQHQQQLPEGVHPGQLGQASSLQCLSRGPGLPEAVLACRPSRTSLRCSPRTSARLARRVCMRWHGHRRCLGVAAAEGMRWTPLTAVRACSMSNLGAFDAVNNSALCGSFSTAGNATTSVPAYSFNTAACPPVPGQPPSSASAAPVGAQQSGHSKTAAIAGAHRSASRMWKATTAGLLRLLPLREHGVQCTETLAQQLAWWRPRSKQDMLRAALPAPSRLSACVCRWRGSSGGLCAWGSPGAVVAQTQAAPAAAQGAPHCRLAWLSRAWPTAGRVAVGSSGALSGSLSWAVCRLPRC